MAATAEPAPVLLATGIHRTFGGTHALRGANLRLMRGEVHGLAGQNGSGKSTLLKILTGQLRADAGTVTLDGRQVRFADAAEAFAAGIATVTQETTIVPELSVAENIFLGHRKPRRRGRIDWPATRAQARSVLDRLGLDVDPRSRAGTLPTDKQQMVEIARAISTDARVLILDEPTSSLPDDEAEALFAVMDTLKRSGVAIVFVSHRLNEVFATVDRFTVLRDGHTVASGERAEFTRERLIHTMVGRALEDVEPAQAVPTGGGVLRIRGFTVPGAVRGVDLDVARGEIVGLAGLVGSGRSELLDGIFGVTPGCTGTVEVDGEHVGHRTPTGMRARGVGYVPGDRKRRGLVLSMSVHDNLLMPTRALRAKYRRPDGRAERGRSRTAISRFGVKAASPATLAGELSGGNQQKVVMAKWMLTEPGLLLLDEPTRGVDVAAKADIYRLLEDVRADGAGILVSSSEVPELLLLCDRVIVMSRGRVTAALTRAEATESRIAHSAMGGD